MTIPYHIVLASGSPRRQALMHLLNLPFSVHTANIDETPLPGEPPVDLVCRLSRQKAQAVASHHPQALIIAADTIVVLDDHILGKPAKPAAARAMLVRLRNRDHFVHSAITFLRPQTGQYYTALSSTTVTMRNYTDAEIDAYIATGDSMDKAGGYAIQHHGFAPVARVDGCYAGVMGFPLKHLGAGLARFGIRIDHPAETCTQFTGQPCCIDQQP